MFHHIEKETEKMNPELTKLCVENCDKMIDSGLHRENYEEFVSKLFKEMGNSGDNYMHAAAGISGEAGEVMDAIKKHWAYGKPLDYVHIVEELGDILFYMTAMMNLMGVELIDIRSHNMLKLAKRYPGGKYSDMDAINRVDVVK